MRLLTLDETAELLRVSEGTVRALARREGLPLIRVSPRRYLVPEEGLTEWLDRRPSRRWGAVSRETWMLVYAGCVTLMMLHGDWISAAFLLGIPWVIWLLARLEERLR
jgi:excisionase family DNA binding protein